MRNKKTKINQQKAKIKKVKEIRKKNMKEEKSIKKKGKYDPEEKKKLSERKKER